MHNIYIYILYYYEFRPLQNPFFIPPSRAPVLKHPNLYVGIHLECK